MSDKTPEFYEFMRKREEIRRKKESGAPPPWSDDFILNTYKFTNVKRADDRTTRALVERLYKPNRAQDSRVNLLNCAIFRYFGTIEMAEKLGWHDTWNKSTRNRLTKIAKERLESGEITFTRAYIVPNCGDAKPKYEVVADVIDQLWAATDSKHAEKIWWQMNWQGFCEYLQKSVRGMGAFMCKEVVLDYILCTGWVPMDWSTWTPMGPGARRGAARIIDGGLLRKESGLSEPAALKVCQEIYSARHHLWAYTDLPLDLTDIQFQLCEFDKYMRTHLGDGTPKQKYRPWSQK
jgi:hypothetical protein